MKDYTVIVKGCNWYTVAAMNFEMVWLSERVWFTQNEMVILDNETKECRFFKRED